MSLEVHGGKTAAVEKLYLQGTGLPRQSMTKLTRDNNWHIHSNFLEDNFEYFRPSTVRDDKNNENCPSSFSNFGLKCCYIHLESGKISLISQKTSRSKNFTLFHWFLAHFFQVQNGINSFLGQKLKKSLDSSHYFYHPWLLKS